MSQEKNNTPFPLPEKIVKARLLGHSLGDTGASPFPDSEKGGNLTIIYLIHARQVL